MTNCITSIITVHRRLHTLGPQLAAIRGQSVKPDRVWAWANEPQPDLAATLSAALATGSLDRVVTSSENTFFHARMALALDARTEYVAIFDDDSIPGPHWFANCLETIARTPGILGTAGLVLHGPGYATRTTHGWQRPHDETVEVDLVGQVWFLRREWVPYLFAAPPVTGTNGEDIELAARAWRLAGVRSYCPPHPAADKTRWGSTRGMELGIDAAATSLRSSHEAERDMIVKAEIAAGWAPLFARTPSVGNATSAELGTRSSEQGSTAPVSSSPYPLISSPLPPPSCISDSIPRSALPVQRSETSQAPSSPPLTLVYGADEPAAAYRFDNQERATSVTAPNGRTWRMLFFDGAASATAEEQFQGGPYDAIDLNHTLATQPDPLAYLRLARESLAPGGKLTATFDNLRHQATVASLMSGQWQPAPVIGHSSLVIGDGHFPPSPDPLLPSSCPPPPSSFIPHPSSFTPIRFFTPREVEKLFYRTGYKLIELSPEPCDDLARWREAGSPGEVKVGAMHIAGLSTADAEQFHARRYRAVAVPEERRGDAETGGRGAASVGNAVPGVPCSGIRENSAAGQGQLTTDHGLTSIVIVTHNALAFTQQCISSIRFLTDEPYELVIVDNGSTDGTVEHLRSCPDVKLIENGKNVGFPAAANQGYRASRGRYVLFLNNDVIVTTGWLRRMLNALDGDSVVTVGNAVSRRAGIPCSGIRENSAAGVLPSSPHPLIPSSFPPNAQGLVPTNDQGSLTNDSAIGLVGPCSNCVSGPQQVEPAYHDLTCLDGWSWEYGKRNDGQRQEVDRLVGFCLLVRREVLDVIGGFDERFGIGNFEDDDFCRRALAANWRAVIALDSYIHHFGHASFAAAAVDLPVLYEHNRRLYEEKWRDPVISHSSLVIGNGADAPRPFPSSPPPLIPSSCPSLPSSPDPLTPSPCAPHASFCNLSPVTCNLSCCMIVRNNETTIAAAITSIMPWVGEVIVLDTGSTDRTPDICRQLGCKVYHFPWPDSFSAARNESLKYATGEWIIWLDSDDVIDAKNGHLLAELISGQIPANILGFTMQVHCPPGQPESEHDAVVVDHCKVFRNRPDIRFEGRIHEQVLASIRSAGGEVVYTPLFVVHAGADHSPEGRRRKLVRDFKLLRLELKEHPGQTFALFNLGMTFADARKFRKAVRALERSLAASQPGETHVRKIYALLVTCHRELGQRSEAMRHCEQGLALFPKDAELHFRSGLLNHDAGRLRHAEKAYLAALANDEDPHFASLDRGIVGYKSRQNLAGVYSEMGAWHKAEEQWRKIVEEVPSYRYGWQCLADNLLEQRKFALADALADQLFAVPFLRSTGLVLAAQLAERRGNLPLAHQLLVEAVDQAAEYATSQALGDSGAPITSVGNAVLGVPHSGIPADERPLDELCRLLFNHAHPDAAEPALTRLVRERPDDAAARHNLGAVYLSQGRLIEAATMLRDSLDLRPQSPPTAHLLSCVEAALAREQQAA